MTRLTLDTASVARKLMLVLAIGAVALYLAGVDPEAWRRVGTTLASHLTRPTSWVAALVWSALGSGTPPCSDS